jgi:hypothetical protein
MEFSFPIVVQYNAQTMKLIWVDKILYIHNKGALRAPQALASGPSSQT